MNLFAPIVPEARQHVYYRELTSGRHEEKKRILAEWAQGFVDRDGKFVTEFQTTFDSTFWELYLHAVWRELGLPVDFSHARPDFALFSSAGAAFAAEATIAQHADGYAPAARPRFDSFPELEARLEYQSIRFANAISSKLRKYRAEYHKLPHVAGRPFVLCVAPFDQQWGFSLADRPMRRVLLGADIPLVQRDASGELVVVGEALSPMAWKPSGAEVPFGLFCDPAAAPEISAVLFSSTATFGKLTALAKTGDAFVTAVRYNAHATAPTIYQGQLEGYEESLLDGLHLFVNPHARFPLATGEFSSRGVAVHTLGRQGEYSTTTPNNFLFARSMISLVEQGTGRPVPMQRADSAFKQLTVDPFPDAEPRYLGGRLGTTADIHVAHHRGWTIMVSRDILDDDWGAAARPGTFRGLAAFLEANASDGLGMMLDDFVKTRDLALDAMRAKIDEVLGTTARDAP